jgi:uncharacterized membrane protein (UPF0127 family)
MRQTVLIAPNGERYQLLVPETDAEKQLGANGGIPRPYAGILFNFDPPKIATMTMEKTPFALQIAFVSPDQTVHYIVDARAHSGLYTSHLPSRWVIETFVMWRAFKVGDRVQFART